MNGPGLTTIEIRKQVESEWMRESRIPNLLKAILDDPDAGNQEELRRETERKLSNHRRTYLKSLPSRWDPTDLNLKKVEKRSEVKEEDEERKGKVRKEVEELAGGMVLIGVVEESAWQVVLEWSDDYADWDKMSWRELDRYCELFPESVLDLRFLITYRVLLIQFLLQDRIISNNQSISILTSSTGDSTGGGRGRQCATRIR